MKLLSQILWLLLTGLFIIFFGGLSLNYADPQAYLASGLAFGLIIMFIALGILLERWLPYEPRWNGPGKAQLHDWLHYFLTIVPSEILGRALAGGLVVYIQSAWPQTKHGFWPAHLPVFVQVIIAVLIFDFVYYWYHRSMHSAAWLWVLHRIHHAPRRLTMTRGFRHTFPEWGLDVFGHTLVLWLAGLPLHVFVWVFAVTMPIGLLSHANINLRTPVFLDWLLNTPAVHRLHHSRTLNGGYTNFSAFTMLWDHIFGTYYAPWKFQHGELGLPDDPGPRSFLRQYFSFLPGIWTEKPGDVTHGSGQSKR